MSYDERDAEVEAEIAKLQRSDATPKCLHCGSDKIIPNALVWTQVVVMSDPDAILFKGRESEEVTARVCGICGFVQFFAKNPALLYSVYQQSLKNSPRMSSES